MMLLLDDWQLKMLPYIFFFFFFNVLLSFLDFDTSRDHFSWQSLQTDLYNDVLPEINPFYFFRKEFRTTDSHFFISI